MKIRKQKLIDNSSIISGSLTAADLPDIVNTLDLDQSDIDDDLLGSDNDDFEEEIIDENLEHTLSRLLMFWARSTRVPIVTSQESISLC